MIRKILIEGVRTHERTEIELGRLTCLVGPNGSGKTTVLNAVRFLALGSKEKREFSRSWKRRKSDKWKIEAVSDTGQKHLRAAMSSEDTPPLRSIFHFRMDSEILRAGSEFKSARPELGPNGSQLASVLANWKLSDPGRLEAVVEDLKQIVPALDGLRPHLRKEEPTGFEILFDFHSAPAIPAMAVSEGTLLALGLLAAIHEMDESRAIVLLDDIDRGLHPDAQVELIKLLRELAVLKDLQVVMTTHSPYIVDALDPDEVCVLALDNTGTTRTRKLSEIPGAERYRGMLSTGELWSSHGESWVLDEQTKSNSA